MAELISRAYVLAEYDRQHKGPPGGARKIMEEAPAVDAAPVVRCRDCKHYRFADRWREWECELTGYDMGENWYCADGERKEDDDG